MKIGYYIHHTTISAGGIFTYSIGILRELIKSPDIKKLVIITSNEVAERLNEFRKIDKVEIETIDRKSSTIKFRLFVWYSFYLMTVVIQSIIPVTIFFNSIKHAIAKLSPYQKIFASKGLDVLHVPVQYSPIYKTEVPVIITMHDLQEYHFPEYFSMKEKISRKLKNKMGITDSDHIIVSFNHVKRDIINFFNIGEENVSVCPPPFAENWFVKEKETEWKEIVKKYNLKRKYLLYPAATWQHKNHLKLLEAFKAIRDDGLDYDLVCTGNKTDFYYNTIKNRIEELNLSDAVYFLGIVPEEDLIGLYKNTSLAVIPTLYEAGSGPLYEAMKYQIPVICSNVTSLPDTISNDDFTFNPNDVEKLAHKMKKGLEDEGFRKRNIENSKMRMEYYEKIDYSGNFINVFQNVSRESLPET